MDKVLKGEGPTSSTGQYVRAAKDRVRDAIGHYAPYLARRLTNFHRLEDRRFMEEVILPFFSRQAEIETILFVGTEWYTKPYEDQFRDKDYWTLEIDPGRARFGSRKHIVAPLSALEDHVDAATFDVILCNGVFHNFAMSERADCERAFDACRRSLKPGGWFVLGWNDTEELRPYPPAESPGLARFAPAPFPPTGTSRHRTDTAYRHIYDFYRRPSSDDRAAESGE